MFLLFYKQFFCYRCSTLTVALCVFCHFSFFSRSFLLQLREGKDQESDKMTQSGYHMQQLNARNEGHNIGGAFGVFSGGSDRLIGQNFSCLVSTAPTQEYNDVSITVATMAIQYDAFLDAASLRRSAQIVM